VDIEASARKHGVSDDDMLHALRHHWRGFETDDPGTFQVPERLVNAMTTTRAQRANALERWADDVDSENLVEAETAALRTIAELVEQRDGVDTALLDAIRDARGADRSWSEIGAMLGVSKQAAQRKYAGKLSA
jgi:hypothetical protein